MSELVNKNILIISPESWAHIFVSKHHYAIHLAERGNRVVFANPPRGSWSLDKTEQENLSILNYPKFIPGLRRFPPFISRRVIKRKLLQVEAFCEMKFDLVWSFDNSVFFDFTLLKDSFNISHIVDLNQNFETRKAAQSADLCLAVSDPILHRLKAFNAHTHFINHGYNDRHAPLPTKAHKKKRLRFLYAGNLDMPYLDWKTLYLAFAPHEEVDLVLIGPKGNVTRLSSEQHECREKTLALPQTITLGKISANQLMNEYADSDALLVCYQEKYHTDQANLHKMMEYLGSGKPVLSTDTLHYRQYAGDRIIMTAHNSEFGEKLSHLIAHYSHYNAPALVEARQSIAQQNTYTRQIQRIEKLIAPTESRHFPVQSAV